MGNGQRSHAGPLAQSNSYTAFPALAAVIR
jgi:hypothetical protein